MEYLEESIVQGKSSSPFRLELSMHDRNSREKLARRVGWSHIANGLDDERIKEEVNTRGVKPIRRLLQNSKSGMKT